MSGFIDAFVAKLNRAGSKLIYSTYLGGSGGEFFVLEGGIGIAVDRFGQAHLTGPTNLSDFRNKDLLQPAFGDGLPGMPLSQS